MEYFNRFLEHTNGYAKSFFQNEDNVKACKISKDDLAGWHADLVNYLNFDGKPDEEIIRGLKAYEAWRFCSGPPKMSDIRMALDGHFTRREWGDRKWKLLFDVLEGKVDSAKRV